MSDSRERPTPEPPAASATARPAADAEPVDLGNPLLAVLLGLVIPGLGHAYQRRLVKAAIYFVCVMGLFGWGMGSAEGKSVYFRPPAGPHSRDVKEFIGYLAQAGVGVATWPAVAQHFRYHAPRNSELWSQREPLTATFRGIFDGELNGREIDHAVEGRLDLQSVDNGYGRSLAGEATLSGGDWNDRPFRVGGRVTIDQPIDADSRRVFRADVLGEDGSRIGSIDGFIRRPLWDWYAVPLSPDIETDINKRLGTDYDLAYIIVMVAGLLNILALYDAFDGPAIGRRPVDSAQTSHERSTAKGAES